METLTLTQISASSAVQALQGARLDDPARTADLGDLCASGQCFELVGDGVRAVYEVQLQRGTAWVSALAGSGKTPLIDAVMSLVDVQARDAGAQQIAFQTARPGLMKKAVKHGYSITGWILRKQT